MIKNFLLIAFLLFQGTSLCVLAEQSESMHNLNLKIINASATDRTLTVRISNLSEAPLNVWKTSNTWGAARWRILITKAGHLTVLTPRPDAVFTRNVPRFRTLGHGESFDETLTLDDKNWYCSSGEVPQLVAGDEVVVVYDVPTTPEAQKMNVWFGFVADLSVVQ